MTDVIGRAELPEVVRRHLVAERHRNLRESTVEQRRLALIRLQRALSPRRIIEATPEDLAVWYAGLTQLAEGRATELSHVRSFYRWALREDLVASDPTVRLRRPRLPRRIPRPMPDADMERAIDEAPDRIRPWLVLAAYAGLRAMEVASLRVEDVRDRDDPPVLFVHDGKGGKQRVIPMSPTLVREYRRWDRPARGHMFQRLDGRPGPVPAYLVSGKANEYLKSVGITHTFHTLRHAFATELYRQVRDLRLVQEVLGHASPVTTAGYAAWSPTEAAAAVQGLWQR